MKKVLIILGVLVGLAVLLGHSVVAEAVTVTSEPVSDIREGDVIFQTSQSRQSPLIQAATRSKITHCGIIVMRSDKPYVLETLKTLVLTPLDKFISRGEGGKYWIKRSNKESVKIEYSHYLGKPYDFAFSFDNKIYYCSELVYDIYLNQLGIELCTPKRIDDYLILGTEKIPQIKSEMQRRGITLEQHAVAPVDIFNSEELKLVRQNE